MTKALSRTFPFLSTLCFLSSLAFLSSFALATKNPFLEETLEWAADPSVSTAWQVVVSFDTFFIFCILVWILYTYCCPERVWRCWQQLFVFFSTSNKEEDCDSSKSIASVLETHFKTLQSKKEPEQKPFRWMNIEEAR